MTPDDVNSTSIPRRAAIPAIVQCPHCSAENPAREDRCSSCGKSLAVFIGAPPRAGRYSLRSIMILIFAVGVGLAKLREDPVSAILILVVVVPGLIRALYIQEKERAWGTPISMLDTIGIFVSSVVLVCFWLFCVGMAVGMGAAFLLPLARNYPILGVALMIIPAAAVGWWVGKVLFIEKKQ